MGSTCRISFGQRSDSSAPHYGDSTATPKQKQAVTHSAGVANWGDISVNNNISTEWQRWVPASQPSHSGISAKLNVKIHFPTQYSGLLSRNFSPSPSPKSQTRISCWLSQCCITLEIALLVSGASLAFTFSIERLLIYPHLSQSPCPWANWRFFGTFIEMRDILFFEILLPRLICTIENGVWARLNWFTAGWRYGTELGPIVYGLLPRWIWTIWIANSGILLHSIGVLCLSSRLCHGQVVMRRWNTTWSNH